MARLYQTGFELGSTTAGVEGDTYSGTVSISTTTVHGGAKSLRTNPAAASGFWRTKILSADSSTAIAYLRFYIYIATTPSALIQLARIENVSSTGQAFIRLTTGNQLQLMDSTVTQIGSNSAALTTNTWYRVELKYDPTTQALDCRLNGTSFASGTGSGGAGWGQVILGVITTATADLFFDDVAINDNSGSFQNSYPGDGKIVHMHPTAAGDNTAWGIFAGSSNWSAVSEVTPDSNTSAVQSLTANATDDYALTADASIGASDTINVLAVGVYFEGTFSSGNSSFVTRLKAASGGTVTESSVITPATTVYTTNVTAAPRNYTITSYQKPGTATAWTQSDLSSAQIGLRISTSASRNARVSTEWLSVDFTPAAGGGTQTITATGIASTAALGVPTVKSIVHIAPTGIASTAALGAPTVKSIAHITPTGIASAAVLGAPTLVPGSVSRAMTGISSGASLGSPTVKSIKTVTLTGITSSVALGSPAVTPGTRTISPTGIASSASLGSPTIHVSAQTISPASIASTAQVGSPTVLPGAVSRAVAGIASTLAIGSPTVKGRNTVSVTGITLINTFGTPTLEVYYPPRTPWSGVSDTGNASWAAAAETGGAGWSAIAETGAASWSPTVEG